MDSTWEGLFWCLCKFLKIPVERTDRAEAIEWAPGQHYAPDFKIGRFYVEVKGLEDEDDPAKWDAWNNQTGRLLILDQKLLDRFRKMDRIELAEWFGIASVTKA